MSRRGTRTRRARAGDDRGAARAAYGAAERGDFGAAIGHFHDALAAAPASAPLLHDLAEVLALTGDTGEAIARLSRALALDAGQRASAVRLSELLKRYRLVDPSGLERKGLEAALGYDGIDHQPLVRAGIALLKQEPPLAEAVERGRGGGWDEAARWLLSGPGKAALGDRLLLACLARGINPDVDMELLLTAVRKRLLGTAEAGDLSLKAVYTFACALIRQCANNEYVFFVSDDERRRLAEAAEAWRRAPGSGGDAIRNLMLLALYQPVAELLKGTSDTVEVARMRPRAFRDLVGEALAVEEAERASAATIGRLGRIENEVSRRVGAQYEANPYPRWLTTVMPAPGSKRDHLRRFTGEDALAFFERRFDVLIAGCGTGQHAIQAAFGYGPRASLLATDLSRASLAYAARMAATLGAANIHFLQGDILDMAEIDRDFDVIECVGVLHHMADPGEGLRRLVERLRPGGLMRLGLYSDLGRRDIARFREATRDIPQTADDDAIRRLRRDIITGGIGGRAVSESLAARVDFFTLSACRDLLFHTHERRLSLPEIGERLAALDLEFLGFDVRPDVRERFRQTNPDDGAWLDLGRWWAYEQEHPSTFKGMYRFWCRKPSAGR